jgi:hypoxanthine phosphoribosyltransferase
VEPTLGDILAVRDRAELIVPAGEVDLALDRLAQEIAAVLGGQNPLVLCVMTGAVVITGALLMRLDFPLRLDYVHATRYRGATQGGYLRWIYRPSAAIAGQAVLVLDDILDEGVTLAAILDACRIEGARSIHSAVLVEKQRSRPCGFQADFVGVRVPNRYLFGCGLDYKGYLRNAPGIFAIADRDL